LNQEEKVSQRANNPIVKLVGLLGLKECPISFEDRKQLDNKSIKKNFNPLFRCLGYFLQLTHQGALLSTATLTSLHSVLVSLSDVALRSSSGITNSKEVSVSDATSRHFIEEVLFISTNGDKFNAKLFNEVAKWLTRDGSLVWWQLVSHLVDMYKVKNKQLNNPNPPAATAKGGFGFGFGAPSVAVAGGGGGSLSNAAEHQDEVPITAVANLLAFLQGNFTSLALSEHSSQAYSLMYLLHSFVSSLPPNIIYNPDLMKTAATSKVAVNQKSASSSSTTVWDEEEEGEDDSLGEEVMSNGIKGLELRVNQERRRQLSSGSVGQQAATPSSLSNMTSSSSASNSSAEKVLSMLCKPSAVASLFDAILPEVPKKKQYIHTGASSSPSSASSSDVHPATTSTTGHDDMKNESILLLCSTYGLLLTHGPHRSTSLLQVLALKVRNSIARLWTYFCSHFPVHALSHTTNSMNSNYSASSSSSSSSTLSSAALLSTKENPATMIGCSKEVKSAFYLLVCTCSRLLLSVDDDDYFTYNRMLEMDDQLQVVHI
jgi:hypothetical protein